MREVRSKILLFIAGLLLTQSSAVRATSESVPACAPDVRQAFTAIIPNDGLDLRIETRGFFSGNAYTQRPWNRFGHDNHFQGLQTLRDPSRIVFSGAHRKQSRATLFFAKIDEKGRSSITHSLDVGDARFWHAGGISRFENFLAVPVEAYKIEKKSRIVFFDVSEPDAPRELPELVLKREHRDAGAVALNRLVDGRYLLLVYSNGIVDLYTSRNTNFTDGFDEHAFLTLDWRKTPELNGSNLNFVRQCDGRLFIVSLKNTGKAPPLFMNGKDYAGLSSFDWNDGVPRVEPLEYKHFHCGSKCNFAGAAGAQIDENGRLSISSTYTFRNMIGSRIRLRVFE